MANYEVKMRGRTLTPASLVSRLEAIGIKIPDQSKIPHMMEATRIGLLPTVSPLRLSVAWFHWLKHLNAVYEVFDYDDFIFVDHKFDCKAHSYGGKPPKAVAQNVETIRKHFPETTFFVHATFDDPWLEVRLHDESVFINCWMRPCGRSEDITLVI